MMVFCLFLGLLITADIHAIGGADVLLETLSVDTENKKEQTKKEQKKISNPNPLISVTLFWFNSLPIGNPVNL